jgi:Ca-activated chloride channel family protein
MKGLRFSGYLLVLGAVCLGSAAVAAGQESASSASVARSRAITTANILASGSSTGYGTSRYEPVRTFMPPDEVAVEEFVNYHRHRLPMPRAGEAVAMDVRFGNDKFSTTERKAVLQIGFTTANFGERTDLQPLNLSLVIDKSGSMAEGDKMSRVKQSLHTMIGKLRPEDIVSIVVFDTDAAVLFPASRIGDGNALRRAIDCLEPNGSTNLHAGLMLGYKEAAKNLRKDATNRVILLTDGIANVGVVQPEKIAAESSEFNGTGIDLSTIGVGLDLNNDLLRTLAKSGRGLYHFVSDYHDIEKVFSTEVQSLISSVAKRVEVSIEPAAGLEIERIYGYSPKRRGNVVAIPLDDMNNGLTQVVLMDMAVRANARGPLPVKVRLTYFDTQRKRLAETIQQVMLTPSDATHCNMLADTEVRKNHTIGELALSLAEMKDAAAGRNYGRASNVIDASIAETYKRYPNMEDSDVKFVLNIVEGYQRDLRAFNGGLSGDCGQCR